MPRKTSKSFEAPKENKIFGSIEEIERARKRLVRRVSEVKALADSDPMDKNDIRAVESKVIDSLRETYGADSA